jgi:uncharacterized YccA/Bax inhibitor family protein
MAFYKSSNPILTNSTFSGLFATNENDKMTIQGTANKTAILLAILVTTACITWYASGALMFIMMIVGIIGGLITGLILAFKKTSAPMLAPIYAAFQGLVVGGLSAYYNGQFEGIVFQATLLTFATAASLLLLYKSRIIKVTENFKLIVGSATMAVGLLYLVNMILMMFGINMGLGGTSLISIGISVLIVGVAAFNLVMDFDFIEEGAERGAPKYMEWYAAFGLMVTLIWLYLEILKLLSKLNRRK